MAKRLFESSSSHQS